MPHILTLIADRTATSLSAGAIARVRDAVQGDRAVTLSPGEAADIFCAAPPDIAAARAALDGMPVDAIAGPAVGRRRRLLLADMDSTIVTGETLDELAAHAGLKDRIAEITRRSMNGEVDFAEALRLRVAMLKGLTLEALAETWKATRLTSGARTLVATMRAHGALTALVSGGFTYFTARVAALAGFAVHRANTLLDDGVALTGEVAEPILDRDTKLSTLRDLAAARSIPLSATLAIGDGANDLAMLREAGLGIAFRAKPIVAAEARARIEHADLRAALFAQGFSASEFRED
ncbi:MAG: phosphoserine phosphatase SerB [Acidisphaera sp.]|nr:phosphoserine phosphatase SerB [Acidisphaera sp.]